MQPSLHIKTKILPGNKIEIQIPDAAIGDAVDVFVILPEKPKSTRRSAIDIINKLPGQRLFKTPEEVDKYLQEERDSWDR